MMTSNFERISRRCVHAVVGIALAGLLAACGGGGGSAGDSVFSTPGAGTGTGTTPTAVASDLVLTLSVASLPSDGSQTALASVTAVDAKRNTLADVPVAISVNSGAVATPSGSKTSIAGLVTAAIGIGSDATKRTITVTASSGSLVKTLTIDVKDPTATGTAGPTLDVALSSTVLTPKTGATATVTLRSANGVVLPNVLVAISLGRSTLATISPSSVLTDANGIAGPVTLTAGTAGVTGADEVIAVATVGGVQITGRKGYTVQGATATLGLLPASTVLKASTAPTKLDATVIDAKGTPVFGQVVKFASRDGNVSFSASSVLTNASGVASTMVSPKNATVSAADSLQATTTLAGIDLLGEVGVQIIGESPSVSLTLASSNISGATNGTAIVRDGTGTLVPNAVVSFSSQFNLVSFDAKTSKTDVSGSAKVVISPLATSTSGADIVVATVTVGGIAVTQQTAVQITGSTPGGTPVLQIALSTTSISAASPADVTATLKDSRGAAVVGQVVTFSVTQATLAKTNVLTALTDSAGEAHAQLSPASSSVAGAAEVVVATSFSGANLQASKGFQVQATNVSLDTFTSALSPLSAYGQTTLSITLTGASVTSPANLTVTSACVALGKATISPSNITATRTPVTLQYRDNGCGAVQLADQLQVVIDGTANSKTLTLPIDAPAAVSLAFIQALPESIYLKGSGFTESSIVTFEVRDAAGNPLPGRVVELRLLTGAGGVTMEGRGVESISPPSISPFTQTSNALGRVSVRVNSGTQPTPVRIHAMLQGTTGTPIATVSSNLSVAIGLPSQLNFSMSQGSRNIEGYNIDGTPNTYQIIGADRSGNPLPVGTSINFVSEGGQVEAIKQTQLLNGISRTTANFVSSEPRPVDGRITVIGYALGEESFIDLNGDNVYTPGEPFQDLGNIFKDRNFDGIFDQNVDEFFSLSINNSSICAPIGSSLLARDASIPSVLGTCDGKWSGAGQVYVRRAVETVLSTSASRPLWSSSSGLVGAGSNISLLISGDPTSFVTFRRVAGDTLCSSIASGVFSLLVADANPIRLNPMALGTVISASSPTTGFFAGISAGSPVPSTTQASTAFVSYNFSDAAVTDGLAVVSFVSPVSGTSSSVTVRVVRGATAIAAGCP